MYLITKKNYVFYILRNFFILLLFVLSSKFRVVKLQNGLTALLISGLEKANYDDTSYKDYEEGSSTVKRLNTDVWKV